MAKLNWFRTRFCLTLAKNYFNKRTKQKAVRALTLLSNLTQSEYPIALLVNIALAASHSRGSKPPCWRAQVALGQDKQKTYII